jgi:hypothetical protein
LGWVLVMLVVLVCLGRRRLPRKPPTRRRSREAKSSRGRLCWRVEVLVVAYQWCNTNATS